MLIPLQRHRIAVGALLFLWSASAISANTLVAPFPNAPGPADAILFVEGRWMLDGGTPFWRRVVSREPKHLSTRSWPAAHSSLSTQSYQNGLARTRPDWLGLMLYMQPKSIILVSGFLAMRSWRTKAVSLNDGQSALTRFSQVTQNAMRPSVSLMDPWNGRHAAPRGRRWRAG